MQKKNNTKKNNNKANANKQVVVYVKPQVQQKRGLQRQKQGTVTVPKDQQSIGYDLGQAGSKIGNKLGKFAGSFVDKIFGFGAYDIKCNSLMPCAQVPSMHSSGEMVVIRHRELISEIQSPAGGTIYTFALNPGMESSFPWLSSVATNFQEYRWLGLVYEFKTDLTEFVTSSTAGYNTMATQYRSDQGPFPSRLDMLNTEYVSEARTIDNFFHPIECDPAENPSKIQYVRSGPLPANSDLKTYDLGLLNFSCYQPPVGTVIGQLWATYEVALYKPTPGSDQIVETAPFFFHAQATATPTNALPLGPTPGFTFCSGNDVTPLVGQTTAAVAANAGVSVIQTNGQIQFTLPMGSVGTFYGAFYWNGTTIAAPTFSGATYTNGSTKLVIQGTTGSRLCPSGVSPVSATMTSVYYWSISPAQAAQGQFTALFGVPGGTVVPTNAGADFICQEISNLGF